VNEFGSQKGRAEAAASKPSARPYMIGWDPPNGDAIWNGNYLRL